MHAVFAAENAHHCAHLSFKPMADPKGKVKCQESAQVPVSDLFSNDELARFADFAVVKLNRTSMCVRHRARRRQIARWLATWRNTLLWSRATTTRTMPSVSSGRPLSAASSLARCPKLACACPPDLLMACRDYYSVLPLSRRWAAPLRCSFSRLELDAVAEHKAAREAIERL